MDQRTAFCRSRALRTSRIPTSARPPCEETQLTVLRARWLLRPHPRAIRSGPSTGGDGRVANLCQSIPATLWFHAHPLTSQGVLLEARKTLEFQPFLFHGVPRRVLDSALRVGHFWGPFEKPGVRAPPPKMPLTDDGVRNAKPREKWFRMSDGKGLYLQVEPNGSKCGG
jgi:hypothetical protein